MQKGFAPILVLVGILVIIGVAGGVYFLGKFQPAKPQNSLVSQTSQPTSQPTISPSSSPDIIVNWKTYTDSKNMYSFRYPADWEILDEVSQNYRVIPFDPNIADWKLADWLNSKMFGDKCRGPILRNLKVDSTIVAFEVVEKNSDGMFCWSNGDFTSTYKRTIQELKPSQEIPVIKWRLGDYIFPVTKDNSGQKYSPEWKGDLFQQILAPTQNSKYNVVIALVYKEGTDSTAEQVYDQILSTFKFTP